MGTSVARNGRPPQREMSPEGPIITHSATVPDGVTTQALIKGDGVQVHENDRVVAQFTVLGWTDGVVRVSTWETGVPQVINLSTAMRGLQTALVDQKVGSRLAITIPPDLAAGDDTLCIVIDILGTEPEPERRRILPVLSVHPVRDGGHPAGGLVGHWEAC